MQNNYPNLVLAYHGCDSSVQKAVIGGEAFVKSENPYDWLGHGIYFWENDCQRAYEWAECMANQGKILSPAVVGAVLDLGNCLNLMERESIEMLRTGYDMLESLSQLNQIDLPQNRNVEGDKDLLLRNRDCAVIQQIHQFVKANDLKPYDSVRGMFIEGEEVYPGSGFRAKSHIQICVVNPNCIIGCFSPRNIDKNYPIP